MTSTIVVDASVFTTVISDDGHGGDRIRTWLSNHSALELCAPNVFDLEVLSAIRHLLRREQLSEYRARQALKQLEGSTVVRYPHGPCLFRVWELRDNITAYDASYVALAEMLHVPLLTADQRLANAPGLNCQVELFEPEK